VPLFEDHKGLHQDEGSDGGSLVAVEVAEAAADQADAAGAEEVTS
jgi:hypothetical protein